MKVYITSDLHLMHKNICGDKGLVESRRVFKDEIEMTEHLIKVHNEVVRKDDLTYNLGDISLTLKPKEVFDLLCRMNGRFIIIKGNHDSSKVFNYLLRNNFELPSGGKKFEIHDVGLRFKKNGIVYHLTHYPLNVGNTRNRLRSIHGHIHENESSYTNHFNVCVDSPELPKDLKFGTPLLLDDVIVMLENKIRLQYEMVLTVPK